MISLSDHVESICKRASKKLRLLILNRNRQTFQSECAGKII